MIERATDTRSAEMAASTADLGDMLERSSSVFLLVVKKGRAPLGRTAAGTPGWRPDLPEEDDKAGGARNWRGWENSLGRNRDRREEERRTVAMVISIEMNARRSSLRGVRNMWGAGQTTLAGPGPGLISCCQRPRRPSQAVGVVPGRGPRPVLTDYHLLQIVKANFQALSRLRSYHAWL